MTSAVLAVIPAALVAVSVLGWLFAPILAKRARLRQWVRAWKMACGARAVAAWTILGVAVQWLAWAALTHWASTPLGDLVVATLIGGVLAGAAVALAQRGQKPYWRVVHDTLATAIPEGTPQRRRFNQDHALLLGGGPTGATALSRIINAGVWPQRDLS